MPEERNYFSIIPYDIRHDKELPANVKLLYGDIASLTHKDGYCYASNSYLAQEFNVTPQAISKWVNLLKDKGYIRVEMLYNGTEVKQRKIFLMSNSYKVNYSQVQTNDEQGINNKLKGYQQKIKDNNKNIIINNNNISSLKNTEENPFPDDPVITKTNLEKPLTQTEQTEKFLATLPIDVFNGSRECAQKLVSYLSKLQNSNRPAINLKTWQKDFIFFSKNEKKTFTEISKIIDFAFTTDWANYTFGAKNIIKNYGKMYQQMNSPKIKNKQGLGSVNYGKENYFEDYV